MIRVEIPGMRLNTLNIMLNMHWAKRHKTNKAVHRDFAYAARIAGAKPKPDGKMHVHIMQFRKRLLDEDNLYGSVKPLLDAVKEEGFIENDNPSNLSLKVGQVKSAKDGVVILIQPLSEAVDEEVRRMSA